jgi:hypothetical protein
LIALIAVFLGAADKPKDTSAADREKLQGTWQFVQAAQGNTDKTDDMKTCKLFIDADAGQERRPTEFAVANTEFRLIVLERAKK